MQTINNYAVSSANRTRRIYPQVFNRAKQKLETIAVTLERFELTLQRAGAIVVFSRYWHQGNVYYRDSRDKGHTSFERVLSEVARMLRLPASEAQSLVTGALYC